MKRIMMAVLMALSLGGCALTVDEVSIDYKPASAPTVMPAASAVSVAVSGSDSRTSNRDRISVKKNGYGMEMAAIVTKQDVPALISKAIESELVARGFRLGNGPVFVLVDVNKFYNDFKNGFFSGQAVGETSVNVSVRNADGRLVYAKSYIGEHTVEGVMMFSGANAKAAMDGALAKAIGKMAGDEVFLQALIEAQRSMASNSGRPTS